MRTNILRNISVRIRELVGEIQETEYAPDQMAKPVLPDIGRHCQ